MKISSNREINTIMNTKVINIVQFPNFLVYRKILLRIRFLISYRPSERKALKSGIRKIAPEKIAPRKIAPRKIAP